MNYKICHISLLYRPYFAGRGIYLEKKVFKQFERNGVNNIVITANFNNLPNYEVIDNVEIYRIPMKKDTKKWNLVFSLYSIFCLFKIRKKIKIIHMHGFWDIYGLFLLFAKIFKKKIILHMTLIGGDDPLAIIESYKLMNVRFKFLSRIDAFISISSPMSDNYKKSNLPHEKLFQIPNGVDTKEFFPAISPDEKICIRKKFALPTEGKIVVFIGAIIKRKGVDLLLKAWIDVNREIHDAHLILIGPDTFDGIFGDIDNFRHFKHEMDQIVQKNQLRVQFIGKSDHVPELLKACDLFVLPSRAEGFGNVVIEAMACGLPVILTEMDGIAYDLIIHGEQGFVIHDSKELAERIIELLENEDLSKSMGQQARKKAVEKFDLEKICGKYIDLYRNLVYK